MTTTVKIEAHCSSNKVVIVTTQEGPTVMDLLLQDGESAIVYAYDARVISVREQEKLQ